MIAYQVLDSVDDECPDEYMITLKINQLDKWKFMRWIDLMNAFDDMRKSSYTFNKLLKEITDDYDKDEQSKSDVGYI